MSDEYKDQIREMGEEIEAIVKKVIILEERITQRIEDLELRNKKVENECNAMIVKFYEQDAASNGKEPAWQDV